MSKYKDGYMYTGDKRQIIGDDDILIERDSEIVYDGDSDSFFPLSAVFSELMDLYLNDNLSLQDKALYQKRFDESHMAYGTNFSTDQVYIDERTIKLHPLEQAKINEHPSMNGRHGR